ncbi:MAG: hypothetical protein L3K24_07385 [Gammaproteobacteria bacterium]|nr:hypothetical protein [Gammaproteobacteria bacterium]
MEIILTSILTSTVVVGIIVSLFKESIKAKFNIIIKDIDSIKSFQSKDFDHASQSIKNIWNQLANIDDYLRHGLPQDIQKNQMDNNSLRQHLLEIQKEMVLLPNNIYESTENSLNIMSGIWAKAMKNISTLSHDRKTGIKSEEECIGLANNYLSELSESYNKEVSQLRIIYRSYIESHIKIS